MEKFKDKVIWITGASSGIGEALAIQLAQAGARLIISARNREALELIKERCAAATVEVLPMDLERGDEMPLKVEWVLKHFGSIDILINNAGISQRSLTQETSSAVYRKLMEVNFFGTEQLTRLVIPHFLVKNQGVFVTMSSLAGQLGLPLRSGYCASKCAIEGFFAVLRSELWKTKIHILVVRSGAVKTSISRNALLGDGRRHEETDSLIENGILPEACAKEIIKAIVARKKQLITGSFKEKLLLSVSRFYPSIAFNLIKKLTP
ncbi:MAG: SDR family oxidoreductase [Puia sp.]